MGLKATLILCMLSLALVASSKDVKLDGFPVPNSAEGLHYYGKEILIDNNRVWAGESADFVRSDCFTMMRVHSNDSSENYYSWAIGTPAALIGDSLVIAEQGIFLDISGPVPVLAVPPSDVAIAFRKKNGQLQMYFVKNIHITNPPWDPVTDENDLCILELETPIDYSCLDVAPAVVSCDKENIFSGDATSHKFGKPPSKIGNVHNLNHRPSGDKGLLGVGGINGGKGNTNNNGWGNVGSGWGQSNNGWTSGWTTPKPTPPPQPKPTDCIYVSWGLKDDNYMDAPTNISSTYSPVKIYNLDECRDLYSQVNYYIDPYNLEKFCVVNANDGTGPTCAYDYNGLTYCYFGDSPTSRRRLLVGGMTNAEDLCPTQYPSVITRYAFYAELFARVGLVCCDPRAPTNCNCKSDYANLPSTIGPYFCPTN